MAVNVSVRDVRTQGWKLRVYLESAREKRKHRKNQNANSDNAQKMEVRYKAQKITGVVVGNLWLQSFILIPTRQDKE